MLYKNMRTVKTINLEPVLISLLRFFESIRWSAMYIKNMQR